MQVTTMLGCACKSVAVYTPRRMPPAKDITVSSRRIRLATNSWHFTNNWHPTCPWLDQVTHSVHVKLSYRGTWCHAHALSYYGTARSLTSWKPRHLLIDLYKQVYTNRLESILGIAKQAGVHPRYCKYWNTIAGPCQLPSRSVRACGGASERARVHAGERASERASKRACVRACGSPFACCIVRNGLRRQTRAFQ